MTERAAPEAGYPERVSGIAEVLSGCESDPAGSGNRNNLVSARISRLGIGRLEIEYLMAGLFQSTQQRTTGSRRLRHAALYRIGACTTYDTPGGVR